MRTHTNRLSSGRKPDILGRLLPSLVCLLSSALCLTGCGMDGKTASTKADEKVYAAIDKNWHDTFGSPTDHQVDPNAVRQDQAAAILDAVGRTKTLTLDQAVQLATLVGAEYRTEVELMYLTGLDQYDAEHLYDFIPFGNASVNYAQSGSNETMFQQANVGMQKLLATGATILTDLTVGYLDVRTGNLRGGSSSIFRTAIVQPLLRGSDRLVVLETLTQAQQNTLYAVRDFNRFRKTFCVSVVSDYYQVTELAQRAVIAEDNVRTLEQLVSKMEDLLALGRLTRFELEEAKQDILKARQDLLEKQKLYAETLDLFKVRLNIPPQMELEPSPQDWLMLPESLLAGTDWTEQKAVEIALTQRLDLANTLDQIADARRKIKVAEDALGADLALIGVAAPASGTARSRYELGLAGSLPLDRVTEANNYKRSLIVLTAQERLYEQQTHTIVSEVRKAWRDMAETQARYTLLKDARELARKRLDNTTLLLRYGRANTRDVLDAQEDLYDAEDDFATALADYSIAQMNFLRDTDTLWVLPNGSYETRIAAQ